MTAKRALKPKSEKPFKFMPEASADAEIVPKRPAQARPEISDEVLRLRSLRLVLEFGCDADRRQPFGKAAEIFNFVKGDKP